MDKNSHEEKEISNGYFKLLLSLTVLSGTIFASSIALSQNKEFNPLFFIGVFLLFLSTSCGFLILWSQMRAKEWLYFFDVNQDLQKIIGETTEDFIKKSTQELIDTYDKLMDRRGISFYILKVIKVDYLPTLFFISIFFGLFLLWLSMLFY